MSTKSRKWFLPRAARVAACAVLALAMAARAGEFETPAALEAASYLDSSVLRGDHYEVRAAVENDGYMNTYTVASDFGDLEAYGEPLLAVRLREVEALAELDRLSRTQVFADAVARGAISQVTTVAEFATHPVETIKGIPQGVGRFFTRTARTVKKGAETVKEATGGGEKDGSGEGGNESGTLEEGAEAAQKYANKYFGVTGAERR